MNRRTPLTRHKQLQSWGDWHRKRKPLKKRSPKYAAQNRKAENDRALYLLANPCCAICAYQRHVGTIPPRQVRPAVEVHHLCGRNDKAWKLIDGEWQNKYEHPRNRLGLCRLHHDMVTDDSIGTGGLCAAAKAFVDPKNYDPGWLLKTRPKRFACLDARENA